MLCSPWALEVPAMQHQRPLLALRLAVGPAPYGYNPPHSSVCRLRCAVEEPSSQVHLSSRFYPQLWKLHVAASTFLLVHVIKDLG